MMNILIVSNNDACRSRMAMEILTSFGRGVCEECYRGEIVGLCI